ncbi:class I adenylate-forming enzyme family protein [Verminephrobacter eiseniae]|uniref:class I adenylate-forming enzyme family protein n=1 Tax=Verminephrobacter eiseniae TaxID=364317 RepID=UPI002238B751|nr:class I adenylate-forming enzyme family protein [Verminephrobacter eiseniae]MCW5233042.1 cyclohexanecarboxylate-CoA ligase [Verminephrobacter eiseniae]MCW5295402.1 cyclohexanecarboxylate-CoA ligase [Verminephrobacter eiseniae]MCW8186819.1 cyclohexanecarboxylate-CoA ligase [Verminephrobacter eiseniae]MCW8222963.1 cyclohexanecarboxylate-CoA ligase [Verminephrobacter eiseniae]MCW8233165.1 cyclohexanecarboxylate-CoA ligase [Verminephrobacter eiseniae]
MSHLLTLHDPAKAREHYLSGVWQTDTLYSLARRHAAERGQAYAVRDCARRLSWNALVAWVDVLAADLHAAGLRRGDRVSVWLPNRLESVLVFLACSRNGYVCNPSLHQNYTVAEIATLLSGIGCRALFAQPDYGADARSADIFARAATLPGMQRIYALPGLSQPGRAIPAPAHALPEPGRPLRLPLPAVSTNPDQVVYLAFTSGTTGQPKGVMHSDNTLLANGRALVQDWRLGHGTALLTLSPMSHHIGTVALEQMLVAGCELVLYDPLAEVAALDWIATTGATYVMGVPTHAIDLLQESSRRGWQQLGAVEVFYMAGAPIPSETARRLLALGAKPQNVYGMTENGSHQYTRPSDPVEVMTGTCGKSCSGYEVRLWNAQNPDLEAAPGEIGEIGGRGGELMLGYFSNQSSTEQSFNRSGWFLSGDLGRLDAEGNLQIVGRKKDLIIRGGHNIHPAPIEERAHRHPAVRKAAAFGVADARLGEKVCLAVICDERAPMPQEMLQHLAQEGLSKFDMPEFYAVVQEFPLTPSGKISKRELVQWVASGRVQPEPVRYRAAAQ